MEVTTIGLDLAKNVFQAHGADASGATTFRKQLRRKNVLEFFGKQPICMVAMEACAGAHYWAREIGKLGHTVKLIPPAYVKPFVKRQKSEDAQASGVVFRARDLLVRQKTQVINALRGYLAEYGFVIAQGPAHVAGLIEYVVDNKNTLPEAARSALVMMVETLRDLEDRVKRLDHEIARRAREDEDARRLATIPGVGPITATALIALASAASTFKKGRDFAAWLGLTPLQRSTGGKQKPAQHRKWASERYDACLFSGPVQWYGKPPIGVCQRALGLEACWHGSLAC